jgi:homoprotocatechuate degradation regulator HpaR
MQLMRAREAVMQRFRPHLAAHGLSDQQWRVLRALAEVDSLEIQEVAQRCAILAQSLSRILPRLEQDGLLSRRAHPQDQRRVLVALTSRGRALFAEMNAESEAIYARLAAEIGPDRLDGLYALLDEVLARLGASPAADA